MVEPETSAAEDVVQCEHCGALVRRKATERVTRSYMGRAFDELWCLLCVGNVDENTKRATRSAEGVQSPSELGLDA